MRATPPECTGWGSCLRIGRTFCVRGKETRDLDLLGGEDVDWKEVSERALCLQERSRDFMEDGVIQKSKITA